MNKHEFIHPLGEMYKDIVTGFEGIATYRVEFITGCDHYGLAAKKKAEPTVENNDEISELSDEFQTDVTRLVPKGKAVFSDPGQPTFLFEMGENVQDLITGFKGVITSRIQYYSGELSYNIQPPSKNGKVPKAVQFGEKRLKSLDKITTLPEPKKQEERPKGGPAPKMSRRY